MKLELHTEIKNVVLCFGVEQEENGKHLNRRIFVLKLLKLLSEASQARRNRGDSGDTSPQLFGKFSAISKTIRQRSVGQTVQKLLPIID